MRTLKIYLFGCPQVAYEGEGDGKVRLTRAIQLLLAYLLINRHRMHSREVLAGLFWGDYSQEKARGCLNTALWRLRRALEPSETPNGTYLVSNTSGEIGFNPESSYWLDVAIFEELIEKNINRPINLIDSANVQEIENALELYRGDLLEGVFQDWALQRREHLRLLYLKALAFLVQYYNHTEEYDYSLACAQKVLELEPLREEVHREVMNLYLILGQRPQALRQYEICRTLLAAELGIPPMEETQSLYERIIAEQAQSANGGRDQSASLQQAIQQLHKATHALEQAQQQLQNAMHLLKDLGVRMDQGE
jgi:DNA-binding SARP family transcriptional activator